MSMLDPYAEAGDHGPIRFLHRLNPLAKIAAPLPAMALLVFVRDVPTPLVFLVIAVLLVLVGAAVRPILLAGILGGLVAVVGLLSLSFGVWTDRSLVPGGTELVRIGDYAFTSTMWLTGLATALRLGAILALSLAAGLTSTGADLVRAMVQTLRVPYRIGYTALAAFRFVPRFAHELDVIRSAHRVRGMTGGRGPLAGLRRYGGYVVPLLAGAIRHAERVALAMDARAFGAHPSRTERHLVPFRTRDIVFVLLFWALSAAVLVVVPALDLIPLSPNGALR